MSGNQDSHYFEVIQEQLQRNKLVTFKWLSRKLKIHCAVAKSLMEKFVADSANKSCIVTYLIFGKTKEGDLVITLSKQDELSSLEDDCVTIVDKYVYCIESEQNQFDELSIYVNDKSTYELNQLCLSSINYPSKIVPKAVSTKFKHTTAENAENKSKADSNSKSSQVSPPGARADAKTNAKKVENVKSSQTTKGNVTQMFDNQRMKNTNANNTSQSTNNVSTDEDGKKITKTTTLKPVKGGLSQLFEKQRQKNTSKKTTNVESNSNDDGSTKDSAKETACVTKNEKNASKETSKQDTSIKSSKKSKSKGKKKMKRITVLASSSEEEQSSEEENMQMEEEPEYEPKLEPECDSKITGASDPVCLTPFGKKRKRKVVEKTVCDEDGYLHTTKEFVYESCESDEDDENNKDSNNDSIKRMKKEESNGDDKLKLKTENNKVPARGVTKDKPLKTKQVSIMNFFKKS